MGRDYPSTCESVSGQGQSNIEACVLPKIDEDCNSVFSTSVTHDEMLEYISGRNSLCRSTESVASFGHDTEQDTNHSNKTLCSKQNHYMSESNMVRETLSSVVQLNHPLSIIIGDGHERVEIEADPSNATFINDNNSVICSSTSSCSNFEVTTNIPHPEYYITNGQELTSTISEDVASNYSNEVEQCSDQSEVIQQEGVDVEDSSITDDD